MKLSEVTLVFSLLLFGTAFGAALTGCTDSGLQAYVPSHQTTLDDKLELSGTVCTEVPSDQVFPVKVLFIVDTSDSMQVTDPNNFRVKAVTDVINRFSGNPAVEIGVIAFNSKITQVAFSNTPNLGNIQNLIGQRDLATDYQGALSTAYTMLSLDMQKASPAERARSKYVVIFFSDGTPDPTCSADPMVADKPVCNALRENWTTLFPGVMQSDLATLLPALQAGGDYNQPYQIDQSVDDIVRLQDIYRVGELRFNTAFLFDPMAFARQMTLGLDFNLDHDKGAALLGEMSMRGGGTYTEFNAGSSINFFNVNYTSIQSSNSLAQLFAYNRNAWLRGAGIEIDTDGDGLPDTLETGNKYCVGKGVPGSSTPCTDPTDSDGDGYGDFVEHMNLAAGFDPLDPKKPATPCADKTLDTDGDGLKDCEEAVLGTDPRLFDSDGDRIPDRVELWAGMNPLDPTDAYGDANHNQAYNIDELKQHLNPMTAGPPQAEANDDRYVTHISDPVRRDDGRTCYDIDISNIRLVTTGAGTASERGDNFIYLYFIEAPLSLPQDYGNLQIACVRPRYVDGALKNPPTGKVMFPEASFKEAGRLDETKDCLDFTSLTATGPDGGTGDGGTASGP